MFLVIYISVFALHMLAIQSQDVCDCNEMNLLKGIVQKIVWDQKVESTKLAELEAWRMSNHVSSGTTTVDFVERLERMEKKVSDIDEKLDKLIEKEDTGDEEDMDAILRKTITSEKQQRLEFVKDVKKQMMHMIETIEVFKSEINETIVKVVTNINKSGEDVKKVMDETLTNIKDETEIFMDAIVMNITSEMNENVEHLIHFDKSLCEARRDIKSIQRISMNEKVDGKWSGWALWSSCSVSCGSGNRYRERLCSSPPPSELGKQCEGNSRQMDSCAQGQCRDKQVAFHAYGIAAGSTATSVPTFSKIVTNIGNDYNKDTGIFTCEVPGIYAFSVTLTTRLSMKSSKQCFLESNSKRILDIYVNPRGKDEPDIYPATSSGVVHLSKGDTVYIASCGEYNSFYDDESTNFNGFLVAAYE